MSYDTKFRPHRYSDVLGQEETIQILRRFVATGTGYQQSYLFAGPYGSGKTTLGRILARALLCSAPTPEGDPCDICESCKSLLESGTAIDFMEVDAATNSGKADIQKIKDEIEYATFSGKRRIYLFDESHQLSRDALDAMLKPLEENVPGSPEKRLVCIFCTTEPEKMKDTILSRCATAFIVKPVAPADIAGRLEMICKSEGIEYDPEVLKLIAEITECHIRDALKAVEGIAMLGPVNKENATTYLHLDLNAVYLDVLTYLGTDLGAAMEAMRKVLERTSPVTCYERLAEICILAYQTVLGAAKPSVFWDADRLKALGVKHGNNLLGYAARFATRPGRPSETMLYCDLGHIHYVGGKTLGEQPIMVVPNRVAAPLPLPADLMAPQGAIGPLPDINLAPEDIEKDPKFAEIMAVAPPSSSTPKPPPEPPAPATPPAPAQTLPVTVSPNIGRVIETIRPKDGEVRLSPRAIEKKGASLGSEGLAAKQSAHELSPADFCRFLALRVAEMNGANGGQKGQSYMDHH